MEPCNELPEFMTLMNQLNKELVQKDQEVKHSKRKKYQRDTCDYKDIHVFKWLSKLNEGRLLSTSTTLQKELKVPMVDDRKLR